MNTSLPLARLRTACIAACALLSLHAFADERPSTESPAWTFPASITLVSDYIFRGQSQTWSNNNSPPAGGFAGDFDAGITDDTSGSHYTELNAAYPLASCWMLSAQHGGFQPDAGFLRPGAFRRPACGGTA